MSCYWSAVCDSTFTPKLASFFDLDVNRTNSAKLTHCFSASPVFHFDLQGGNHEKRVRQKGRIDYEVRISLSHKRSKGTYSG